MLTLIIKTETVIKQDIKPGFHIIAAIAAIIAISKISFRSLSQIFWAIVAIGNQA